ncbi:NAP-domain-containing protein [Clavulina sp. PMI_390]|nr:NAP-domain-containing protein [Clavulina sp. PMI_390]
MSDSSQSVPFSGHSLTAPTPVNTPLNPAPIAQGLSRPTVADIPENDDDDDDADGPADALAGLDEPSKDAINAIMQHKLASLIGKSSGYIENLPVPIKRRVEGLKGLGAEYDKLLKKQKAEMFALQKKHLAEAVPLRQRRADVIVGKVEPTKEEVDAGEAVSKEDDEDYVPLPPTADPNAEKAEAGIPEFWLTALKNHIAFSELITDRDEGALKHLVDITLDLVESTAPGSGAGFTISFHFTENAFFENTILTKQYIYKDELDVEGDYLYEKAVGCEIKWKEDQNLTQEIEVKRQRNKATNKTRVVRRSRPTESFFNFFDPPMPPSEDEAEDIDDDALEDLEESLEMDYQLGQDLKDRVIPRAVDYFTGKALQWEEEDEEDDYADFDDDEDEEDEDDDDEDDVPAARRRPAGKGGKSGDVDPQECKQQ